MLTNKFRGVAGGIGFAEIRMHYEYAKCIMNTPKGLFARFCSSNQGRLIHLANKQVLRRSVSNRSLGSTSSRKHFQSLNSGRELWAYPLLGDGDAREEAITALKHSWVHRRQRPWYRKLRFLLLETLIHDFGIPYFNPIFRPRVCREFCAPTKGAFSWHGLGN